MVTDTEWHRFAEAVKIDVWGYPPSTGEDPHFHSSLWRDKYGDDGEVVPGWNTAKWIENRWAGYRKTSTRGCHTALTTE